MSTPELSATLFAPSAVLAAPDRLAALRGSGLLDSPPDEAYDRLTRIVCRCLDVPTALITLVDEDRQVFKSQQGLPEPWATRGETPLSHSFCQYVVRDGAPLEVHDARNDMRLRMNLAIDDLGVVAYLGTPLRNPDGQVLGAVCAIDGKPRRWKGEDRAALETVAAIATMEIQLRKEVAAHQRMAEVLRRREAELVTLNARLVEKEIRYRALFEASPLGVFLADPAPPARRQPGPRRGRGG